MGEWIGVTEAAELLDIATRTVQRSLGDPDRRQREWGAEGEGWRYKPLAERPIYQLRRTVVLKKAGKTD